jgi:hypothetical protein
MLLTYNKKRNRSNKSIYKNTIAKKGDVYRVANDHPSCLRTVWNVLTSGRSVLNILGK